MIENSKQANYFSEKLLDALVQLTGLKVSDAFSKLNEVLEKTLFLHPLQPPFWKLLALPACAVHSSLLGLSGTQKVLKKFAVFISLFWFFDGLEVANLSWVVKLEAPSSFRSQHW